MIRNGLAEHGNYSPTSNFNYSRSIFVCHIWPKHSRFLWFYAFIWVCSPWYRACSFCPMFAKALVTQPMMQRWPNPTELRSMDYYHQIFCRFQKCKRKVPPPSPLSNDFEKNWVFLLFFLSFCSFKRFFQNLKFLNNF
jgi:hypothetical protein